MFLHEKNAGVVFEGVTNSVMTGLDIKYTIQEGVRLRHHSKYNLVTVSACVGYCNVLVGLLGCWVGAWSGMCICCGCMLGHPKRCSKQH
jgi:hypothetical protein